MKTPILILVAHLALISLGASSVFAQNLQVNEVLFDTHGQDGGREWVEIYNASTVSKRLDGIKIKDHLNALLFTFPRGTLPPGGYAVVVFGPTDEDLEDTDPSDGYARFYTDEIAGEYLFNDAGGVFLKKGPIYRDAVFWGNGGAPSGFGYANCINAGAWPSGAFVDTSFIGGNPLQEGDSIGRNVTSTDTNTAADWQEGGGENAVMTTEIGQNNISVLSSGALLHQTQGLVNDLLISFGGAGGFTISVTNASHNNLIINDPGLVGGYSITADHTFVIDHYSAPMTLTGSITSSFDRIGLANNTSYTVAIAGSVTDGNGTTLTFTNTFQRYGFHSLTRTDNAITTSTWTTGGVTYPSDSIVTRATTQTASNAWTVVDTRSGSDWGSAGQKTSSFTILKTQTGDGAYSESLSGSRDHPMLPPALGSTQSITGTESVQLVQHYTMDADGQVSKTITQFDISREDLSNNLIYNQSISEDSTWNVVRTSGADLSDLGVWQMTWDWKYRIGYPVIDPLDYPTERLLQSTHTREYLVGVMPQEFVAYSTTTGYEDGALFMTVSTYKDAPVQGCGCGCPSAGCTCGSPVPKANDKKTYLQKLIIGAGCVVGSAIAAPAGPIGVGAVAIYCLSITII